MAGKSRIAAIRIEVQQRMEGIGASTLLGKAEEIQRELRYHPPGKLVCPRLVVRRPQAASPEWRAAAGAGPQAA